MLSRYLIAGVALVALTAFAPAPLPKEKPKKGPEHIQGTWVVEELASRTMRGQPKTKGLPDMKIRIEGNKWTFVRLTGSQQTYAIQFDPSKDPCWIDLRSEGNEGSVHLRGIVAVEGDRLKFCYMPKTSEERPRSFELKKTTAILMTLKRERER